MSLLRPCAAVFALLAAVAPTLPAQTAAVQDLPLTAEQRQQLVGVYSVAPPDAQAPAARVRVFEQDGALLAAFNDNAPTRLLSQGDNVFRPEAAADFEVAFTLVDGRARKVSITSPGGVMTGVLVETAPDAIPPFVSPTSGPLYDEIARLDAALFDAAFVACDAQKWDAFLADDVEFYHDRGGFTQGRAVKAPADCPREQGVARRLVEGSLEVFPIQGYGAVERGTHCFLQQGGATPGIAQFVHLWAKGDDGWKVARILSFDHRPDSAGLCPKP
ncbi:MAG: DUF4440 domain-containing protein [Acidobacteria bacterium]|nr:DUF4440 domain-containing protein [Acidobacteriota bacterium]